MRHVSISNEGRSSSTAIGPANDCKWVFNEVPLTPQRHAVVHFEGENGPFFNQFQETHEEARSSSQVLIRPRLRCAGVGLGRAERGGGGQAGARAGGQG